MSDVNCTNCDQKVGGYSPARKVTPRDIEVFRRAFSHGPIGVYYTPLTCMSKVENGIRYLFAAEESIVNAYPTTVGLATVEIFEEPISAGGNIYIVRIDRPGIVTNAELTKKLLKAINNAESVDQAAADGNAIIGGGYTDPHALSKEDKAVFESVRGQLPFGVSYEPYQVATQVVCGANYCFYCKAKAISTDANEYEAKVHVFKALPCYGGDAVITAIE